MVVLAVLPAALSSKTIMRQVDSNQVTDSSIDSEREVFRRTKFWCVRLGTWSEKRCSYFGALGAGIRIEGGECCLSVPDRNCMLEMELSQS